MALSEGTPQSLSANGSHAVQVKIDTNLSVVAYDDVDASVLRARVLDISSGSLSVGGTNDVNTDRGKPDIATLSASAVAMVYIDAASSDDLTIRKLNISGTTITEQTADVIETSSVGSDNFRIAAVSSSVGLVAYTTGPGGHQLCRFTVSGDTITAGTPQAHGTDTSAQPLGLIKLDSSKVVYFYHDGSDYKLQVIDISGGISEGTPSSIPSQTPYTAANGVSIRPIATISSTKGVAAFVHEAATDVLRILAFTTSGTSIDTIGSPVDLDSSGVAVNYRVAVDQIGSSKIIISRFNNTATVVETATVSGTTITLTEDDLSLSKTLVNYNSIPVLTTGKAVAVYGGASPQPWASLISGVPEDSGGGSGDPGLFYFGQGTLEEKFTLPFSGVHPKAMTLDKALGTVVIGSKVASTDPIIYSQYPYATGTATHDGFPTGTSITVVRWI